MAASTLTIFDQILSEAQEKGFVPGKNEEAKNWFRRRAQDVPDVSERALVADKVHRLDESPTVGSMYLFRYDPKTKDQLPYYDAYPLLLTLSFTFNGFTGLNLHYLPSMLRASLMDKLYAISNTPEFTPDKKILANYALLNGFKSFKAFKPCYKRYLFTNVRSKFLFVAPSEWDIALFLPLAQFQKATESTIHSDSVRVVGKRRKGLF
jgi:hypothetical protein